jgi:hypothetical protein
MENTSILVTAEMYKKIKSITSADTPGSKE